MVIERIDRKNIQRCLKRNMKMKTSDEKAAMKQQIETLIYRSKWRLPIICVKIKRINKTKLKLVGTIKCGWLRQCSSPVEAINKFKKQKVQNMRRNKIKIKKTQDKRWNTFFLALVDFGLVFNVFFYRSYFLLVRIILAPLWLPLCDDHETMCRSANW